MGGCSVWEVVVYGRLWCMGGRGIWYTCMHIITVMVAIKFRVRVRVRVRLIVSALGSNSKCLY